MTGRSEAIADEEWLRCLPLLCEHSAGDDANGQRRYAGEDGQSFHLCPPLVFADTRLSETFSDFQPRCNLVNTGVDETDGRRGSRVRTRSKAVRRVGLALPDVEAATKYDGSPVLKVGGAFMAGLATHRSAEPERSWSEPTLEERGCLLEDAPETYYLTDYYRRHPVVLVRLSRTRSDALRDLLSVSWRLTLVKARKRRQTQRQSGKGCTPLPRANHRVAR